MRSAARMTLGAIAVLSLASACVTGPTPSFVSTGEPSASEVTLPSAATPPASPSPTPLPPLSLDPPAERDDRVVALQVAPDLPADAGGRLTVTLTNMSDTRIDEIALRWPTELKATLVLAPFVPSAERIRDGGDPLVQPWTRWVEGPGERGEPAGTTTLGCGPLDAGASITVPIYVTRAAPGPVGFDIQVLAGEALLTLDGGRPGDVRVNLP